MTDVRRAQRTRKVRSLLAPAVVAAIPALVAVAAFLVLSSAWIDRATKNSRDLATLEFGLPWPWLHQDQSALDPPFPYRASFSSPWEHPTTVSWSAFMADIGVTAAVLVVLFLLGAVLVRRLITGRGKRGDEEVGTRTPLAKNPDSGTDSERD